MIVPLSVDFVISAIGADQPTLLIDQKLSRRVNPTIIVIAYSVLACVGVKPVYNDQTVGDKNM